MSLPLSAPLDRQEGGWSFVVSSMLLVIEPWSDQLIAAGFVLLLLTAQMLQFKLKSGSPAPIAADSYVSPLTEIDMPDDLRRFFAIDRGLNGDVGPVSSRFAGQEAVRGALQDRVALTG